MLQHKFVVERADGKVVSTASALGKVGRRREEKGAICSTRLTRFCFFLSRSLQETLTSTLEAYGSSTGGPSAMVGLSFLLSPPRSAEPHPSPFFSSLVQALTVGVPCGVAVQLILDGVITKKGVQQPYDEEVGSPLPPSPPSRLIFLC